MKTSAILMLLFLCPLLLPAQDSYSAYLAAGAGVPAAAYASKSDANKNACYAQGGFSAAAGFIQQGDNRAYTGLDVMLYSNRFANGAFDQNVKAKTGANSTTLAGSYKGLNGSVFLGYMFFKQARVYAGAHFRVGLQCLITPAIDNTTHSSLISVRAKQPSYRSIGLVAGPGCRLGVYLSEKLQFIFIADYMFGELSYYGVQTDTYVNGAYQTTAKKDESVKMRSLFLHFGLAYRII